MPTVPSSMVCIESAIKTAVKTTIKRVTPPKQAHFLGSVQNPLPLSPMSQSVFRLRSDDGTRPSSIIFPSEDLADFDRYLISSDPVSFISQSTLVANILIVSSPFLDTKC